MGIYVTGNMTGKMKGMTSINTNPFDNPFCTSQKDVGVCKNCYSIRLTNFYKRAQRVWSKNGKILSEGIIDEFPKIKSDTIRFHAHGELLNHTHFINFCKIAKHYPSKFFVLWTKRANIVQECLNHKPENLRLIYSTTKLNIENPRVPRGFDKVFSVYDKNWEGDINCEQHCKPCFKCYNPKNTIEIIREELRKI